MIINIKSQIFNCITIEITNKIVTINDFKNAITQKKNISKDYITLLYDGKILNDDIIIKDCNIKNDDTIVMHYIIPTKINNNIN